MQVYRPVPPERTTPVLVPAMALDQIDRIGVVDDTLDPWLMEGVVEQLRLLVPAASVQVWVKPIGTSPAPDSLIEEMARDVQVALAGVGA